MLGEQSILFKTRIFNRKCGNEIYFEKITLPAIYAFRTGKDHGTGLDLFIPELRFVLVGLYLFVCLIFLTFNLCLSRVFFSVVLQFDEVDAFAFLSLVDGYYQISEFLPTADDSQ